MKASTNNSPSRMSQGPTSNRECDIDGSIRVDFNYLKSFMRDCFLSVGVPEEEANLCSDVLISADMRGIDSHGIGRLKVK